MTTPTIAVIGLGYVGLPLAVEFGKHSRTIGFDIAVPKVEACRRGTDPSRELADEEMRLAVHAEYTADPKMLGEADIIIVAVPTPVDQAHMPDFTPLVGASRSVGQNMKKGATVVFESTVYPGATEEVCIPVLERESGMQWKRDFFVGYSPERINPGDKQHTLTKILKVVSGDTPETLERVAALYERDRRAGRAPRLLDQGGGGGQGDREHAARPQHRPDERAVHHLPQAGHRHGRSARGGGHQVEFPASSRPGLVGGHCIGVDPYYLTHKAEMLGYHPQVILAGRRINDGMAKFIAEQTIKNLIAAGSYIKGAKVNVLGLTFKENCGDLRNSKVADVIHELKSFGVEVFVHDPFRRSRGGHARVRRAPVALGRPAAGRCHRGGGSPPPVRLAAGRGLRAQAGQGRLLHRRQVVPRRRGPGARGHPGLASLMPAVTANATLPAEGAAGGRARHWLVTGVAGFIGSNLLEALLALDQRVVGLDNFSPPGIGATSIRCARRLRPAVGRFRVDRGRHPRSGGLPGSLQAGTDFVLHQAALGSVPRSLEDPLATNAATSTAS
jgi:UDP-N-acetyl-D-galactosamine dehydrogenase